MTPWRILRPIITLSAVGAVIAAISVGTFLSSEPAGHPSIATVQNVAYEVRVETEPKKPQVGDAATVRLWVLQNGQPIDLTDNGRLFHVIIVSADVGDISHTLAPTREAVGVYSVKHTFTRPGTYRIWSEVDDTAAPVRHDQHAEQIAYSEISVMGTAASPVPETMTEKIVDSYRVKLTAPTITAGKVIALKVTVTDQAGRQKQLEPHEPFLYAMSGENFSFFRHGHGMTFIDGSVGLENIFPKAGRYVWWMELFVQEGDEYRSIEVPFILKAS